ncbi:putative Phytocyanin domain, cupredoxin [Helianthus debilis subsp. tardiflorus]
MLSAMTMAGRLTSMAGKKARISTQATSLCLSTQKDHIMWWLWTREAIMDGMYPHTMQRCTPSGNDQITLVKGSNSFICSFSDHCNSGMRLLISAS